MWSSGDVCRLITLVLAALQIGKHESTFHEQKIVCVGSDGEVVRRSEAECLLSFALLIFIRHKRK